jgi:SAM-dependent methyltransferase
MAEPVRNSGSSAVSTDTKFEYWLDALEKRHLADLTFPQVSSALRALSSTYVERRQRIREGGALDGAGKRAAFALFYAPLHYLLVREIVRALGEAAAQRTPVADHARGVPLVDLGCGTGAAGAAWGTTSSTPLEVIGLDRHPWAVAEAAETYRAFHLSARTRRADIATAALPKGPASIVAAFTLNEMDDAARDTLMKRLVERAGRGDRLLIVEPIAGVVARWWNGWRARIEAAGGRGDEWRFRVELPPIVAKLDRAAGMNHRELTGRSLWLAG